MKSNRKYFGMTMQQIGILGGLAGAFILILCVGGVLVFRNRQTAQPLPPTVAPTVTSIIEIQPTITPTITPTAVPYEQLVPSGWNQYRTSLVEIWLPSNFKAFDAKDKAKIANADMLELGMIEVPSKTSAYSMVVAVFYDPIIGDSLDSYLDSSFPELPYQGRVVDRKTVYINTVEARRWVFEFRQNNIDFNGLLYVIQDGGTAWYVEYAAEITEYFENLPVFEQSIKTFRIVR